MGIRTNEDWIRINHYVDNEINSIAVLPLNKICLIEYFDDKIEINVELDKKLFYSFYNIEQAKSFIKVLESKIFVDTIVVKNEIRDINYYQNTIDGSKNKIG